MSQPTLAELRTARAIIEQKRKAIAFGPSPDKGLVQSMILAEASLQEQINALRVAKLDWHAIAPVGGWKERTYYIVTVQFSSSNPEHRAILYTGFLNGPDNIPGGYSCLFNPAYDPPTQPLSELWSIRPVKEIEGVIL